MLSPHQQSENLKLVTRFIGWGDPRNPIWFLGLEEGLRFDKPYLEELRKREAEFATEGQNGRGSFWQTYKMKQREASRDTGELHAAEEWTIEQLRSDNTAVNDKSSDARSGFWKYGFHCNLYPLGYQRRNPFPKEYSCLFGVSEIRDDGFVDAVRSRFNSLRLLQNDFKPKATICFGLDSHAEFRAALGLEGPNWQKLWKRTRGACLGQNTIVVAHPSGSWSRRLFREGRDDLIALLRNDWGVRLD